MCYLDLIVNNNCSSCTPSSLIQLPPEKRAVSRQQAEDICAKWKIEFIETSAKTRTNVDEAFQKLVKTILKQMEKTKPVNTTNKEKPEKKSCILL